MCVIWMLPNNNQINHYDRKEVVLFTFSELERQIVFALM